MPSKLDQAAADIQSSDPARKIAGMKVLYDEACREHSIDRQAVLASDAIWRAMLQGMESTDAKLVEPAIGAAAMTIGRYRRDLEAFPILRRLASHKKKTVRICAAQGLGYLPHPERFQALLPMLEDPVEAVRKAALLPMIHFVKEIAPAERAAIRSAAERLAEEPSPDLKLTASTLLRALAAVE